MINLDSSLIAVLNVEYLITEGEITKLVEVLPLSELKDTAEQFKRPVSISSEENSSENHKLIFLSF